MRTRRFLTPIVAASLFAALYSTHSWAVGYYVAPEGSGYTCSRSQPCALSTGAEAAQAGDTVVLLDGVYHEPLHPENSGTEDAWITFRADDCALPIIEGDGEAAMEDADGHLESGVASLTGTYLRFEGLVSRYWDSGFTNGWTGKGTTNSNGHFEYINCIGEGNGRTGLVLYSAPDITIRECIATHNGGNPLHSWSSGIQLYGVVGTAQDNIVERNVAFENTDAQKNTDGSGFIIDEQTQGATFLNNLAFRNGGSCMRLTRSSNAHMIHFSCYHNGLNPDATGPTNPGEFFFTDEQSRSTSLLFNTIAAATGTSADPSALVFPPDPSDGVHDNLLIDSGETPFYSDPEGANPDFRPPASAADQVENLGSDDGAPEVDLGFDPKCIVKQDPNVPFQKSWWIYSIDYDYIRSIGGVKYCFHPKARSGGADLGAYELTGDPHVFSLPDSCVPNPDDDEPPPVEPVQLGTAGAGAGGTAGASGGDGTGVGGQGAATGGSGVAGGITASSPGGTANAPASSASVGVSMAMDGVGAAAGTANNSVAAAGSSGLSANGAGGNSASAAPGSGGEESAGCACRATGPTAPETRLSGALILLAGLVLRRRRFPRQHSSTQRRA